MKDERPECILPEYLAERVIRESIDIVYTKIKDFKCQHTRYPEYVILPKWIESIVKSSYIINPVIDRTHTFCGMIPIFAKSKSYLYEIEVI